MTGDFKMDAIHRKLERETASKEYVEAQRVKYALAALTGLLARGNSHETPQNIAWQAFKIADAMIKAENDV